MKIGIVGGGFMGLALAYKISKTKATVKVFEKEVQPGGLATYYDYGAFIWDKFYHVILPADSQLLQFLEDIGFSSDLRWKRTLTGYFVDHKFYSISSLKEFLFFPPLDMMSKLKLGYTIYYGSRIKNWKSLEKISVEDWLINVGGKKTYEKFWRPLLLAKLGENYRKVSAVFIWTYITRLFAARGQAAQKEHMGYVKGGYKAVFDKLEKLLVDSNSNILYNTSVKGVTPGGSGGINLTYDNTVEHFDKVIFTTPLNVIQKVVPENLIGISNNENKVEYLGVICLVLITKLPISPYYVLNISDEKVPFTGVIGMSSLVDLDETEGYHITYFPKYLTKDHEYWQKNDSELTDIFLDGVKYLYPDFELDGVVSSHINKAVKVQPLQVQNYSNIIPKIETRHQDLFVLNTTQFVNETLNNNSVVKHVNEFMMNFERELKKSNKD